MIFVHKIMLTKYEVLTRIQLRYLEGQKSVGHFQLAQYQWMSDFEHFSLTHLAKAV